MADPQQQTFTDVQPIQAAQAAQSFTNITPIGKKDFWGNPADEVSAFLSKNSGYQYLDADPKFPNRRPGIYPTGKGSEWRTDPNAPNSQNDQFPVDLHGMKHTYEGMKMGAMAASAPLALEATIPQLVGGTVGGAVGSQAGKVIAQRAGGGETVQEVSSDVGGLAGSVAGGAGLNWAAAKARSIYAALPDAVQKEMIGILSPRAVHALTIADALGIGKVPQTEGVYPGAPQPETPEPQVLQAASLSRGPQPVVDPAAGLGNVPVRPGAAGSMAESVVVPTPTTPRITRTAVEQQLNDALGAKPLQPNVPLRKQVPTNAAPAAKLPEGFTPVDSSAIRGYKYDPDTREFESITQGGQRYIHGDVSPEEAAAFEEADSKGRAWQLIRNNPLVAKVINGKRIAMKPASPDEELPLSSLLK